MERHLLALGIKFILVSVVILSLYGIFYQLTFSQLLLMSVLITGISYGVGDLLIYPRLGNLWATIIDSFMYFSAAWLLSFSLVGVQMPITLVALATTYFLTIAEPLFHTYMKERVYGIEDRSMVDEIPLGPLQMEVSEEIDDPKRRSEYEEEQ